MDIMTFLSNLYSLNECQKKTIDEMFAHEEYSKGSKFLKPNKMSHKLIFLEEGLYRTYYFKDNKEITHHFWRENSLNCVLECVFYNEPGAYGWEAIENCKIRSISFFEFQSILESIDNSNKSTLLFLVGMIKVFMDRLNSLQFHSAEERYENLIKSQPDILRRAPLGTIASYIGITQQRLSVIRAKHLQSK